MHLALLARVVIIIIIDNHVALQHLQAQLSTLHIEWKPPTVMLVKKHQEA